jgi:hypothetical protein
MDSKISGHLHPENGKFLLKALSRKLGPEVVKVLNLHLSIYLPRLDLWLGGLGLT